MAMLRHRRRNRAATEEPNETIMSREEGRGAADSLHRFWVRLAIRNLKEGRSETCSAKDPRR
jgi:hypothetical protein